MNGQNDNNTDSTRTGLRRIIPRWEYRHLRVIANLRIGISGLLAIFGILTLAYGAYGWTAFWWGLAAAHFLARLLGAHDRALHRSPDLSLHRGRRGRGLGSVRPGRRGHL